MVMGDVQSLPNGNILITVSTSGQISEVTTGGQAVASFKFKLGRLLRVPRLALRPAAAITERRLPSRRRGHETGRR